MTAGDISSLEELAPEAGAILRRGLKKVAVYRDAAGKVDELSAVCPHLGCIVQWNLYRKDMGLPMPRITV